MQRVRGIPPSCFFPCFCKEVPWESPAAEIFKGSKRKNYIALGVGAIPHRQYSELAKGQAS